jgi:hypothetical protein
VSLEMHEHTSVNACLMAKIVVYQKGNPNSRQILQISNAAAVANEVQMMKWFCKTTTLNTEINAATIASRQRHKHNMLEWLTAAAKNGW